MLWANDVCLQFTLEILSIRRIEILHTLMKWSENKLSAFNFFIKFPLSACSLPFRWAATLHHFQFLTHLWWLLRFHWIENEMICWNTNAVVLCFSCSASDLKWIHLIVFCFCFSFLLGGVKMRKKRKKYQGLAMALCFITSKSLLLLLFMFRISFVFIFIFSCWTCCWPTTIAVLQLDEP